MIAIPIYDQARRAQDCALAPLALFSPAKTRRQCSGGRVTRARILRAGASLFSVF
jgi:hypothetical protein